MLKRTSYLLFILLISCVDPFSTGTTKETDRFVVEGSITNQLPPYVLKISKSANFSQGLDGIPRYVSGAAAKICDNYGNCIPYFEVEKGRYQTANNVAVGVVGNTYHVEITTSDGKRFFSYPEEMVASPPMERGYFEFDPNDVLSKGFNVYVDVNDPVDEQNYYKWETENYYQYSSFCFSKFYERNVQFIASDRTINGNRLSRAQVAVVPFNSSSTWIVQVYQLALSGSAFNFLEQVKKQANTTGSIFDPPPTFLRGNFYNPDNEKDEVLGYFLVAGVSRLDLVIDRTGTGKFPSPSFILRQDPLYCGEPCDPNCVERAGGTCGDRPCPPDCANIPGNTNIAPAAWPFPHRECEN